MSGIAAIVVTYNRKEKLANCIDAILAQTAESRPDIIIADNGSSDGTGEMIMSRYGDICGSSGDSPSADFNGGERGRILYYNLRHNSGGAGGFCFGMRKAVELGYEYLWLMDDDSVPSDTALGEFLRFDTSHHGEYGFLSGKVLWKDGSLCRMNVQRRTLARKIRGDESAPVQIEIATFVSLFLPGYAVMNAGLPYRQFFIWTDDWEYTRRVSRIYPCYLVPDSTVVHDMDQNTSADIALADEDMLDRFRYRYRNDVFFLRQEGLKGWCYEAAKLVLHLGRIARGAGSAEEKARRTKALLRGTMEGLSFFPMPDRAYPGEKQEIEKYTPE